MTHAKNACMCDMQTLTVYFHMGQHLSARRHWKKRTRRCAWLLCTRIWKAVIQSWFSERLSSTSGGRCWPGRRYPTRTGRTCVLQGDTHSQCILVFGFQVGIVCFIALHPPQQLYCQFHRKRMQEQDGRTGWSPGADREGSE